MGDPSILNAFRPARFLSLLSAGLLAAFPGTAGAKVFLNTSEGGAVDSAKARPEAPPLPAASSVPAAPATAPVEPARPAASAPVPAPSAPAPASLPAPRPGPEPGKPHYATALFLSADNMLVYSHLGVLKALEEFKLGVDIVIAESKSLAVAAAWALRYPMVRTETALLERPLAGYLHPHREHGSLVSRYAPYGPDPIQVEIPLGLQSLQAPELNWTDAPAREGDEYLHLSWMVAKLTHDAPGGPVEDLREAPRPLAVQVTDLQEERGKVLVEGNLQSLLKAALLPKDAVHRRKRLWPYASGALVSGHAVMVDRLPFTFDRLILIEPGRRLRPPSLEEEAEPWQDSLGRRLNARPYAISDWHGARVLRIELNPDRTFANGSGDPKAWVDLGYTSALRSMDVLLSTLGRRGADDSGSAGRRPAADSARTGPDARASLPPPLGLNRFTVNPLASGGRQLLQDLVRKSVREWEDSTGDGPISDLVRSGYYGDLDVEWVRSPGEEYPALVFDALEKSRLVFQAAANVANQGEDLPDRGPEMFAALAWNEPFYVPFRAEASALMGGHRPGFALRGMMAPIHPVHLELGIGWKGWRIRYPDPPALAPDLEPLAFRLGRRRTEVFLDVFPTPWLGLGTAIQKHEMDHPAPIAAEDGQEDPGAGEFESTDFQQTLRIAPAARAPSGIPRHYLWARYRNQNRSNLFGPVKYSFSSVEARLRASLGDFRFLDQYYWSDQDRRGAGLFDLIEAGEVAAWSFQDEYFLAGLRSPHFQNVQAEYAPAFGRAGLRLMAGGFRLYGRQLMEGLPADFTRLYWEAQVSYATPAGPLRAGLGGLEGDAPTWFLRFGADLDLDRDGPEE